MNIHTARWALVLGGLLAVAASAPLAVAQSKDGGATAAKEPAAAAAKEAAPNTNTNPVKHRYWRHRGGKHPHYGSRRVRT